MKIVSESSATTTLSDRTSLPLQRQDGGSIKRKRSEDDGEEAVCSQDGCLRSATYGHHYCLQHIKGAPRCIISHCSTIVDHKGDKCYEHKSVLAFCSTPTCDNYAISDGLCTVCGGGSRRTSHLNCLKCNTRKADYVKLYCTLCTSTKKNTVKGAFTRCLKEKLTRWFPTQEFLEDQFLPASFVPEIYTMVLEGYALIIETDIKDEWIYEAVFTRFAAIQEVLDIPVVFICFNPTHSTESELVIKYNDLRTCTEIYLKERPVFTQGKFTVQFVGYNEEKVMDFIVLLKKFRITTG